MPNSTMREREQRPQNVCPACGARTTFEHLPYTGGNPFFTPCKCASCGDVHPKCHNKRLTSKERVESKARKMEYKKRYREEHREKFVEYNRKYRRRNRDAISQKWRIANLDEEHVLRKREVQRNYRMRHREELRARQRAYYGANRDMLAVQKKGYRLSKARMEKEAGQVVR